MYSPKFSVIIPVYNGSSFVGEAIQSVLEQTYKKLELVVVDDASTDHSAEIITKYDDSRIIYIRHEQNKGSNITRSDGIRAATGEIIAFLDQDDYFHPEKIKAHVELYQRNPDIGFSYNARFELTYGIDTIQGIWRPPAQLIPDNFLLGFPIAPSDMVITREWATRIGLIDERITYYGGEYVLIGRLYLAGCKFGYVDRALNYRRRHSGRVIQNLSWGCESELMAQDVVFTDPGCQPKVWALRNHAHANTYLDWGYLALIQGETDIGQNFLRKAIKLHPDMLVGETCGLLEFFIYHSVDDDNVDHEVLLKYVLDQLPLEIGWLKQKYNYAIGRGYLIKGSRSILWGRVEEGKLYITKAIDNWKALLDKAILMRITSEIISYETEYGYEAAQVSIRNLTATFNELGKSTSSRQLMGNYLVSQAFNNFHNGMYNKVPSRIVKAVQNDKRYLTNRGVISIFIRSLLKWYSR